VLPRVRRAASLTAAATAALAAAEALKQLKAGTQRRGDAHLLVELQHSAAPVLRFELLKLRCGRRRVLLLCTSAPAAIAFAALFLLAGGCRCRWRRICRDCR
jgi:hypothetical protein